jgi:hypothetical protein
VTTDTDKTQTFTCSLCGKPAQGFGNNPEPLAKVDERCCDVCNWTKVIPARLARYLIDREAGSLGGDDATIWFLCNDAAPEDLGFLPGFLHESDERPVIEQLDAAYAHGGGFKPIEGFKLVYDGSHLDDATLWYPGDEPLHLIGFTRCHGEVIGLFEAGFVAVVSADGTVVVARMD